MNYFRGELISKEMFEEAFQQSNCFWFLKWYEMKGRYGVYDARYRAIAMVCDQIEEYPRLRGNTSLYPHPIIINVYEFRADNLIAYSNRNYAFAREEDLREAAAILKLRGENITLD